MSKIIFLTGNILESSTEALVNTVNCEGYMGKGLSYQFKKKFPEMNKDYMKVCKRKELKPGQLHTFEEDNKIIINFPTKDKWREKSKIIYIEKGMEALIEFIIKNNIKSIAIPPLGCGNGGLNWEEVKKIIRKYLNYLNDIEVEIYEPSLLYKTKIKQPPKLTLSHLVLMYMKKRLYRFSKFRLQKTAFFFNLYANDEFFKFDANYYGPYSHSIEIISKQIKEFQEYYKFNTEKAFDYACNTLISKSVEAKLKSFAKPITLASEFVNSYSQNEIELYSSIIFAILNQKLSQDEIINYIHNWSKLKKEKFNYKKINNALKEMEDKKILYKDVFGNYGLSIRKENKKR